ncbi:MAG TPA: radical SAM protein [Gemmatimonadales bacterium]|nr:radical SAM protein [Gemmatimonadales bacterium]
MSTAQRFIYDQAPLRVYWEVTRACDLACRHCRAEAVSTAHRDELTTAEAFKLFDRLATFDPKPHIVLTGGDPLKRSDLFDLITAAQLRALKVSVSPSATALLTPEVIVRLKGWGVEAISLSLDGATAQTHDAFRGFSGTFERTLVAAAIADGVGLPVQVNTLVAAETLTDLPAIYGLVRDLKVARWSLFFLIGVGRGELMQPVSARQAEAVMRWVARLQTGRKPIVTTTEAPHYRRVVQTIGGRGKGHAGGVRDGNGILFISHTGDITPAGFLPLAAGNVRCDDVVKIYRHAPLFQALRNPEGFGGRCGHCEWRYECGGSRARAYAAAGDPLAEDPLCGYLPGGVTTPA